ncbi:hypothetical protein ZWY2020_043920 [Hordeum vulgare]|nr:hypothetical protein ZWY2020_043920 [Hordeum vulgare]
MADAADPAAGQNPKVAGNHVPEPWAGTDGEVAEEEFEYVDEEEEELDESAAAALEREKVQSVFRRLSSDPVGIRVHDVIIRGNAKTREELIEAEVADLIRSATTVQDLLSAAAEASARLRGLDVFEAVNITLDAGPPELPGTTNVVIEVVEPSIPISGNAGVYSKPEAKAWSLEGAVMEEFGWLCRHLGCFGCIWQLGHNLLSALKYTYKIDERDSHIRPTKGYAFLSTSQVGGLWDNKGLKFFRQEFDVCVAVPFGFWNAALNVGVGAGVILPLSRGFMNSSTPVTDRFNLGGHSSPVCSLGGISSLLGFRTRGVGPTEPRRLVPGESEDGSPAVPGRDYLGGDLAVSAFADVNYCYILKQSRHDSGKTGIQFSFSSPS